MSTLYEHLGMRTPQGAAHQAIARPLNRFERQLRDIEAGAPKLNLGGELIHLAAEIAAFDPELDEQKRIALILLVVVSLAALQEGSTRFPAAGPQSVEPMRRILRPLCGDSFGIDGDERVRVAIAELLNSDSAAGVIGTTPSDYKPLVYLPPFVYLHRTLSAEIALARRLTSSVYSQIKRTDDARIRELLTELTTTVALHPKYGLSEEQRKAVEYAVTAPLTIISGGPGTGKTSIVIAILNVLIGSGLDPKEIAVAAPTGKAANRIAESIRESLSFGAQGAASEIAYPEPTTVHRLLGYSAIRKRFRHDRTNPLSARVVIVDEGSMLDLELMSSLLDALRLGARLVVLGDADQLPSVSAGAIFRDLLPASDEDGPVGAPNYALNYARLTRNYRSATGDGGSNAIFHLASSINAGDPELFASTGDGIGQVRHRTSAAELELDGAEWLDEKKLSGSFLERWYSGKVRNNDSDDLANRTFTALESGFAADECELLRLVFERTAQSRILCLTRQLDFGSERVNAILHRRFVHDKGEAPDRDRYLAGEPVMVLRNDYERMLFNGDQGAVLRVRGPGYEATRMAVFPRGNNFVAFRVDALKDDLELSYAMTVHKAQGSEFDSVAIIMPDQDIPLLTREILYTAVSRARRSVTVVGSRNVIEIGLRRRMERYSGLREQLAQCLSESHRANL